MSETIKTEENQSVQQTAPQTALTPALMSINKVTKSPGRVEAGKRLAEWNRQKKLNAQAKQQLIKQEDSVIPVQHVKTSVDQQPDQQAIGGDYKTVGVVILIGVVDYFGYKYRK